VPIIPKKGLRINPKGKNFQIFGRNFQVKIGGPNKGVRRGSFSLELGKFG